jgi:hypothetical protein
MIVPIRSWIATLAAWGFPSAAVVASGSGRVDVAVAPAGPSSVCAIEAAALPADSTADVASGSVWPNAFIADSGG